jgi:molybdate transport system substrate-binding protein
LARVPIGASVRTGQPKPDIGTLDAFKRALLRARAVAIPSSTSGIFLMNDVFPRLGFAEKLAIKVGARGADATTMVAAGEADIVLAPVSELMNVAGIDYVGHIPQEAQLLQIFAAAVVAGSDRREEAKRLIDFLTSPRAAAAIEQSGMEPLGNRAAR